MTARSIFSASLPVLGRVYRRFKDNFPAVSLGRTFRLGGQSISMLLQSHSIRQRANRAAAADLDWMDGVVDGTAAGLGPNTAITMPSRFPFTPR